MNSGDFRIYSRARARHKIAELLEESLLPSGSKAFARVYRGNPKQLDGQSPVAAVWNGPLWKNARHVNDVESAGLRVAFFVNRSLRNIEEDGVEDILDRSVDALMKVLQENYTVEDHWTFLEMSAETFLDFPPIESGAAYRREIFDLRVHFDV